jgi:hypothetical protein
MLKQLLLTTAMIVSSTYGSDAQIIDEGLDSNAHNASITVAETAASTLDALNRIQSVFENPNATNDEINDAILKLSKVSTDFRLKIIDMGGDANKPSITFDITPPETKGVVITHTARILTPLVAMLSELAPEPSQINVNGLFSLFLMTGIIPDLTPELLEIYMSDNTLSFISACLAPPATLIKRSQLCF